MINSTSIENISSSIEITSTWGILLLVLLLVVLVVLCFVLFYIQHTKKVILDTARQYWRADLSSALIQTSESFKGHVTDSLNTSERILTQSIVNQSSQNRQEIFTTLNGFQMQVGEALKRTDAGFQNFAIEQLQRTDRLTETLSGSFRSVEDRVDTSLKQIQSSNEHHLEKIRETVEEKLQTTLQSRVNESFRLVSTKLDEVFAGLTEMRRLANDVGSLKQVMVNVKNRGILGEVQLEALLSEYFTASQYAKNVHPVASDPSLVVEFAVRMPGSNGNGCWLPIDAKFPCESLVLLQASQESGDRKGVLEARELLKNQLIKEGRSIARYINPPYTTDFGIMFLPSETLYAEAISLPGLAERLYRESHVYVMGPSTLASALCAYRAGFQSMAIEKQSADIRRTLFEVKTEFDRFSDVLKTLKKQLDTASRTVDQVEVRTRQMNRKLSTDSVISIEKTEQSS